jgi:hypothetical protein
MMTLPGRTAEKSMDARADLPPFDKAPLNSAQRKSFPDRAAREALLQTDFSLWMDWVRILGNLRNRCLLLDFGLMLRGQLKSEFFCINQLGGGL